MARLEIAVYGSRQAKSSQNKHNGVKTKNKWREAKVTCKKGYPNP